MAKRNRTFDSIGQMTRTSRSSESRSRLRIMPNEATKRHLKTLTAGKDRQMGRQGLRFHRRHSTMAKAMRLLFRFESGRLTELFNLYIKQLWKRNK